MKKIILAFCMCVALPALAQVSSVTIDANGNIRNGQIVNFASGKLTVNGVQVTGITPDASTTVKGLVKLSAAPASPTNPIAAGDNDSRMTNARTPTAHASLHANGGTDPVTLIISQITGLQSALDLKAPLNSPSLAGVPLAPTAAVDTNTTQIATTGFVLAQAANTTPIVASTGAVGASTRYARGDHVHPAQTSVTGNAGTATALQTARTINGVSFNGTGNITVTINDAAADGTTKGASTYTAADFNATAGLISLDYTNGQTATGSVKGFLTAADWTIFNGKEPFLGNPPQNGWVLGSTVAGDRDWQRPSGQQTFNVLNYGAWADGTHPTETRAAVVAAEAAANAAGGGVIYFPLGRYWIHPALYLVTPNVTWLGDSGPVFVNGNPATTTFGSTILITDTATEFLWCAAVNRAFEKLIFAYPNQIAADAVAPINPVVYPYTFRAESGGFRLTDCTIYNAYDAVRLRNGLYQIDNCYIAGLHNDLYFDRVTDTGWINNITGASGYISQPGDVDDWMFANKISWDMRRADDFKATNIQLGSCFIGVKFSDNTADIGFTNSAYGEFTGLRIDGAHHGIWASSTRAGAGGVQISAFNIGPGAGGSGSGITVVPPVGGASAAVILMSNGSIRGTWASGPVTSPQTEASGLVTVNNVHGCDVPFGLKTSPAVPASTIALVNPYPFRVFVNVTGGTITAVSISGQAAPIVRGQYELQPGDTIAITYSVAPTWTWSNNWQAIPRADYQAYDADLTTWAGIARAAGFDTLATTPTVANLKTLLSDETTVAGNLLSLANPSAISFIKIAADNTVSTRTPAELLSDIGAATLGANTFSGNQLYSADNTYDIGATGATRPRDFHLARNAAIGGNITVPTLNLTAANNTINMSGVSGNAVIKGGTGGVYFNNNASNATNVGWNDAGNVTIRGTSTLGIGGASFKNIRHGTSGALVAGSVTVTDTGCTANTRYFFTVHTMGTVTVPMSYYASTRTASTSFVITSANVTDTSTVDWVGFEP